MTPADNAFWAFKIGQTACQHGLGSTARHRARSRMLVYYTTFDPMTGATEPTLGISASTLTPAPGSNVTFTVKAYDDAGTAHAGRRCAGAGRRHRVRRERQRQA